MYSGCDKRNGRDGHGYIKYYGELFEPLRHDKINLLEIGIAKGRSHMLWAYYFRNGLIHGLDIEDRSGYFAARDQEAGERATSRIKTAVVDQSDAPALVAYAEEHGPFDIVIDDGSHDPDHQILSFETLVGYTTKYYIIEDLHPYYEPVHGHKTIRYFQKVVNEMNRWGDIGRNADIQFYPKDERIESVTFVPNAIIVRIRQ
jgi:hypothetical protein